MTLAERTQSCLRQMADLAEAGDEDWLYWYAEYCGLRGEPEPLEWGQDGRVREWWVRGRDDREVLRGLEAVQHDQF